MRAWGVVLAVFLVAASPHAPLPLSTLDGAPLEVSLAAGERALVLHFRATWCPECIEELPALDRIAARCAGSGVRVLFVNVGEAAEDVRRFAAEHAIRGEIVRDPKGVLWRRHAPAGLPANLTWTADDLRAEAGPRSAAAWTRALAALGCGGDVSLTTDPSAAPPPPASASPAGTRAPGSPAGS
jgi:thiol-disulfide isomerase/thioredoxin